MNDVYSENFESKIDPVFRASFKMRYSEKIEEIAQGIERNSIPDEIDQTRFGEDAERAELNQEDLLEG
jgi:hypothetical protein